MQVFMYTFFPKAFFLSASSTFSLICCFYGYSNFLRLEEIDKQVVVVFHEHMCSVALNLLDDCFC